MKTNTLEILQKTELQADTAHAIYNAMEMELAAQAEGLATKNELAEAIRSFHLEMQDLKQAMQLGFAGMKTEMEAVRVEMRAGFAAVRGEMNTGLAAVRGEIGEVRGDSATAVQSLRAEMKGIEGKLARWVVTCAIALAGAIWAALHLR